MVVRHFNFRSPSTRRTYDQLTCPLIGYTTSLEDRGGAVYTVAIMRLTSRQQSGFPFALHLMNNYACVR